MPCFLTFSDTGRCNVTSIWIGQDASSMITRKVKDFRRVKAPFSGNIMGFHSLATSKNRPEISGEDETRSTKQLESQRLAPSKSLAIWRLMKWRAFTFTESNCWAYPRGDATSDSSQEKHPEQHGMFGSSLFRALAFTNFNYFKSSTILFPLSHGILFRPYPGGAE